MGLKELIRTGIPKNLTSLQDLSGFACIFKIQNN